MIYRYINMDTLSREPHAGRVLGWVIAANDLALTFYLQDHFQQLIQNMRMLGFTVGSRLYIDRLMCAQTSEAISMAQLCRNSPLFIQLISTHGEAERAFEKLLKMSENPVPAEYVDLSQLLSRIRNKGMFHYYDDRDRNLATWLQEFLEQRVRAGERRGTAMFSEDNRFTRFVFADDVFAEVFFRKILKADTTDETTLDQEIIRLSTVLTEVAGDVRVVGDTIGKALMERFPA